MPGTGRNGRAGLAASNDTTSRGGRVSITPSRRLREPERVVLKGRAGRRVLRIERSDSRTGYISHFARGLRELGGAVDLLRECARLINDSPRAVEVIAAGLK
jgi:hypothetical protein